jgi:hypothetical protein
VQSVANINDNGFVVGEGQFTGYTSSQDPVYAFYWRGGTFTQLPDPSVGSPDSGHGRCTDPPNDAVRTINDANVALGHDQIWTSLATAAEPATHTPCSDEAWTPLDINFGGQLTGSFRGDSSKSCPQPSTDDAAVQPANGDALTSIFANPDFVDSYGLLINRSGQVVLQTDDESTATLDFRLYTSGSTPELPVLPGGSAAPDLVNPRSLNNSGVVVGIPFANGAATAEQAAYSVNAGPKISLSPAGGLPNADAIAVNNDGDVVGSSGAGNTPGGAGWNATLWPSSVPPAKGTAPAPVDLNSELPAGSNVHLDEAVSINDSGQILAHATAPTSEYVILNPTAISIANAAPVNEPTPSTAPANATFTVSLTAALGQPVTVNYQTADGTATAANNDYASTSGTATIPAGQTSTQITVPVEPGGGNSTAATKSFTVQLSNPQGAPLDPSASTATGTIALPQIHGQVTTDAAGAVGGAAGVRVTISGTADTGQLITANPTTDASGDYSFFLDPGTYTVTPQPQSGQPQSQWGPGRCDGTPSQDATGLSHCQIALGPGANATANFVHGCPAGKLAVQWTHRQSGRVLSNQLGLTTATFTGSGWNPACGPVTLTLRSPEVASAGTSAGQPSQLPLFGGGSQITPGTDGRIESTAQMQQRICGATAKATQAGNAVEVNVGEAARGRVALADGRVTTQSGDLLATGDSLCASDYSGATPQVTADPQSAFAAQSAYDFSVVSRAGQPLDTNLVDLIEDPAAGVFVHGLIAAGALNVGLAGGRVGTASLGVASTALEDPGLKPDSCANFGGLTELGGSTFDTLVVRLVNRTPEQAPNGLRVGRLEFRGGKLCAGFPGVVVSGSLTGTGLLTTAALTVYGAMDLNGLPISGFDLTTGASVTQPWAVIADFNRAPNVLDLFGTSQPAPAVKQLKLGSSTFRAAGRGASIAAVTTGTTISYRDRVAGTTKFIIERPVPGVRRGRRCVAGGRRAHKRRVCTRYPMLGSFTHLDTPGLNRFRFTGRLSGRKLKPGSYRLSASVLLGARPGRAVTAAFKIIP